MPPCVGGVLIERLESGVVVEAWFALEAVNLERDAVRAIGLHLRFVTFPSPYSETVLCGFYAASFFPATLRDFLRARPARTRSFAASLHSSQTLLPGAA